MVMSDVSEARVEWLTVVGQPDAWRSIGLTVTEEGLIPLIGPSLRIVAPGTGWLAEAATGIVGWALSGIDEHVGSIDGLATEVVAPGPPIYADHELGASALDHVVVLTHDLERTADAITVATGCELKRIREVGAMRQSFHRIGRGGLIAELVERPEVPEGSASFWGVVINVADIHAACERVGPDRVSMPTDAVQPGRRVATIRDEVGLGLPVALMTD
jgi:predicted enzyme related to lactoylglutathione lyase